MIEARWSIGSLVKFQMVLLGWARGVASRRVEGQGLMERVWVFGVAGVASVCRQPAVSWSRRWESAKTQTTALSRRGPDH